MFWLLNTIKLFLFLAGKNNLKAIHQCPMQCNMRLEAFAVFRAKNATDHETCALSFLTEITSRRFLTQRRHKRLTPTPPPLILVSTLNLGSLSMADNRPLNKTAVKFQ